MFYATGPTALTDAWADQMGYIDVNLSAALWSSFLTAGWERCQSDAN
jgi:hypothetical protein